MNVVQYRTLCFFFFLLTSSAVFAQNSAFLSTLTAEEKQWLIAHPQVTFTADPNWLPFEAFSKEGEYIGIVSYFLQNFSEASGVTFKKLKSSNWVHALEMTASGNADVLSDVVSNEVVWKTHTFTHSYLSNDLVVLTRDLGSQISNLNELGNTSVGFIKDYGYIWTLRATYPNTHFVEVENIQAGLAAVANGDVDYFVASYALIQFQLARSNIYGLKIRGHLPITMSLGLAVRNDWPEFRSILNKWIDSLTPEARYHIAESWYLNNTQYFQSSSTNWKSIGIFSFVILILLGWGSHVWFSRATLAHRDRRFADALLAVDAGEWEIDLARRKFHVSADFFRHLGLAQEDIPESLTQFLTLLEAPDADKLRVAFETAYAHGKNYIDLHVKMAPPYNYWIAVKGGHRKVEGERSSLRLIGTVENITDYKYSESERQEKESLLQTLFDALPDAISLKSKEGKTTLYNTAFLRFFHAAECEVAPEISLLSSETMRETWCEAESKVLTDGQNVQLKAWFGSAEDEKRCFDIIKVPFRNGKNDIDGVLTVLRDETETYWLTQTLENFRRFAEYSEHGFGIANFDTSMNYVNPKLLQWLAGENATDTDILNKAFKDFYPKSLARKFKVEILPTILSEGVWQGELQLLCFDGSLKSTFETFFLIRDEDNIPLFIGDVIVDISEQKKVQLALEMAKNQADRANASKSIFLANMSHEIRTPLNAVLGYSQLLIRNQHLDGDAADQIQRIYSAGQRLLHLINDVLDLSKIESGKLSFNPQLFDLHAEIQEILQLTQQKAQSKSLNLIADVRIKGQEFVVADKNKVGQIIINLLDNAIKFTHTGSVTLTAERSGENIQFSIVDSGEGIAVDDMADLFKPFSQGHSGVVNGGTGLGLVLSRRIAEAMGGTLELSSQLSVGTRVDVILPLAKVEKAKASTINLDMTKRFMLPDECSLTVLIIEDDELSRDLLNKLLLSMGFTTVVVKDGESGVEAVSEVIDIVFTDIRLPGISGVDVLGQLRKDEQFKTLPIIAVTASSLEHERRFYLEQGFTDFISKPIAIPDVITVIESALAIALIEAVEVARVIPASFDPDAITTDMGSNADINISTQEVSIEGIAIEPPLAAGSAVTGKSAALDVDLLQIIMRAAETGQVDALTQALDELHQRSIPIVTLETFDRLIKAYDFDAIIALASDCLNDIPSPDC